MSKTSDAFRKSPNAGLDFLTVASMKGSSSMGAVYKVTTVLGSWPAIASSIRIESRSASVRAWVEMMIESGSSWAPVAVSRASYSSERGPLTWPNSSWMIKTGDNPYAVEVSADKARYSVPRPGQNNCLAVSLTVTKSNSFGDIRTVLEARLKISDAWSRD